MKKYTILLTTLLIISQQSMAMGWWDSFKNSIFDYWNSLSGWQKAGLGVATAACVGAYCRYKKSDLTKEIDPRFVSLKDKIDNLFNLPNSSLDYVTLKLEDSDNKDLYSLSYMHNHRAETEILAEHLNVNKDLLLINNLFNYLSNSELFQATGARPLRSSHYYISVKKKHIDLSK